jgi:quercetin dioxygenase-like cupin family protein
MSNDSSAYEHIPNDDLTRRLTVAASDGKVPHVGLVGDTYTILLTGRDTAGRYSLIDMYIPPGGGPPPHRHDFEESFSVLEGEIVATFRGSQSTIRAGEVVHIPANAPHYFKNQSQQPARLLCVFTGRAGRIFHAGGRSGGHADHTRTGTQCEWAS